MLAPRKKLWSTPLEVIDASLAELRLSADDIFFDVGAGDGRLLVNCALKSDATCIGVEIDEERAVEANKHIDDSGVSDRCSLIVGNALEQDYSAGTAFFLYLVPRGLRIFLPFLKALGKPVRVVTYMSPLPGETPEKVLKIPTASHSGAEWPLFVYTVNGGAAGAPES